MRSPPRSATRHAANLPPSDTATWGIRGAQPSVGLKDLHTRSLSHAGGGGREGALEPVGDGGHRLGELGCRAMPGVGDELDHGVPAALEHAPGLDLVRAPAVNLASWAPPRRSRPWNTRDWERQGSRSAGLPWA